jgi:hypothetical protein
VGDSYPGLHSPLCGTRQRNDCARTRAVVLHARTGSALVYDPVCNLRCCVLPTYTEHES